MILLEKLPGFSHLLRTLSKTRLRRWQTHQQRNTRRLRRGNNPEVANPDATKRIKDVDICEELVGEKASLVV